MKKLIVSILAIGTFVVAISAAHAAWVCEQPCSDFMRVNGGCLTSHVLPMSSFQPQPIWPTHLALSHGVMLR